VLRYPHTPVFCCKSAQTIDSTELTISLFAKERRKSAQVIDYLNLVLGKRERRKMVTLQSGQNCLRTHYITPVKPKVGAFRRPGADFSALLLAPGFFSFAGLRVVLRTLRRLGGSFSRCTMNLASVVRWWLRTWLT